MKRFLGVGVLVIALMLVGTAFAWGGYIFQDPIFQIGDQQMNVLIGLDVPARQTVSDTTQVYLMYPRNLPVRLVDPLGTEVHMVPGMAQFGPVRICLTAVQAPLTDQGAAYPVSVTLADDAGFSLTLRGRAGRLVIVPYIQF